MKMIYTPPKAELVLFAADHPLAAGNDNSAWWSFWQWGAKGIGSITGTKEVWESGKDNNWIYAGQDSKKPY